jgi:hypothetical protein
MTQPLFLVGLLCKWYGVHDVAWLLTRVYLSRETRMDSHSKSSLFRFAVLLAKSVAKWLNRKLPTQSTVSTVARLVVRSFVRSFVRSRERERASEEPVVGLC